MSPPHDARPLHVLLRDLVLALLLGVALFAVFSVFNHLVLNRFNEVEVLLLEAGGIVLVALLVARALSAATRRVMERQGGSSRVHAVRLFLNIVIAMGATLALFRLAGVSLESIFLGSALAGIVLGLAAQTVLANVFAGLLLVISDPFRPGDRIAVVSSSYGAIAPSYPHEMMYPGYTGVVEDIGLTYTTLRLAGGSIAKVPNNVVIGALLLTPSPASARNYRVRMTFPLSVPVSVVEAAVAALPPVDRPESPPTPGPRLEVADLSASTWDAVIVVWATELDETFVRDRVLRSVLSAVPRTARTA
jgi:small-conductance mechanosensitive channel